MLRQRVSEEPIHCVAILRATFSSWENRRRVKWRWEKWLMFNPRRNGAGQQLYEGKEVEEEANGSHHSI